MAAITTAGGRRINFQESGDGAVILMISGIGSPKGGWVEAIERLAGKYHCLAIDNRDAGENDPETAPYTVSDMADDSAAFIRAKGLERATIMGSSMGGFIALHMALNHPDVVERLVLVGTSAFMGPDLPYPVESDWVEDPMERAQRRLPMGCAPGYFDRHPERLDELASQTLVNRMTFAGFLRQSVAIIDTHDVRARLHEIGQPALVVHGDLDASIPLVQGECLAAGLPNGRLVVLDGVGHIPHREVPDRFCRVVDDFLSER